LCGQAHTAFQTTQQKVIPEAEIGRIWWPRTHTDETCKEEEIRDNTAHWWNPEYHSLHMTASILLVESFLGLNTHAVDEREELFFKEYDL
jgi:hypothetical protein